MPRVFRSPLALLTALLVVLAGCGDPPAETGTTAGTTASATTASSGSDGSSAASSSGATSGSASGSTSGSVASASGSSGSSRGSSSGSVAASASASGSSGSSRGSSGSSGSLATSGSASTGSTASASSAGSTGSGSTGSGSTGGSSTGSVGSSGTSSSGSSTGGTILVTVTLNPPVATAVIGTSVTFTATAAYSDGSALDVTAQAVWSSDNTTVATVAAGRATAVQTGIAHITASWLGHDATAELSVSPAILQGIAVTPATASLGAGSTTQLQATATFNDGSTQDVTSTAVWSSSSSSQASVSGGLVRGIAQGVVTITATLSTFTATAQVTVGPAAATSIDVTPALPTLAAGQQQPFLATATYADGSVGDVTRSATWSSSAPTVLTVDAAGNARALVAGTSLVTATLDGLSGTTTVTVTGTPLVSITISPQNVSIPVGLTQAFAATGTYSDGSTRDLTASVTWSVDQPRVASLSNTPGSEGVATALSLGSVTVTAQLDTVSGATRLTAVSATATGLTIAPGPVTTPLGVAVALTATSTFSDGSSQDVTEQATWSSSDASIAQPSNATGHHGETAALAVGQATLTATFGGQTATTNFTVTSAALRSIAVTPAAPSLATGQKLQFAATGTYSDGSSVDLSTQVVWSTGSSTIATISNAAGSRGLLSTVAAGSTPVVATLGSVQGQTTLTVTAPTLSQLVISPSSPRLIVGQNAQLSATAIFSNNTSQNVTQQAQWSSSTPATATIGNGNRNPGGLNAVAAGSTTITATYRGLSTTTVVTVTAPTVVSVQVTPIQPRLPLGSRYAMTATAVYSDGTSRTATGRDVTWVSSAPAIAQVSNAGGGGGGGGGTGGTVQALALGSATISATVDGLTGSTTVTVTDATPTSLSVFPAQLDVPTGTRRQLTAQVILSDGTSRDVTANATWTSSAPNTAAVDNSAANRGLLTGIAAGSATISATLQGLTGSASITVTAATLSSIQVSPFAPSVAVGTPLQFQAVAIYSDGSSLNVTEACTWVSSAPSIAQVSDARGSRGITQTLAGGTARISATVLGVTGSSTLTVTQASLVSIQVTPFGPTLPVGYATAFQATALFSDNTTQDVTRIATWTSSDGSVAQVGNTGAQTGVVQPLAAGSTTLTATYAGVRGSQTVSVVDATLQSITISPANPSLALGATQQLQAQGQFSDGSTLDVTAYVTWLSSADATVSVSNAIGSRGQAKALGRGTATISAVRSGVTGTTSITVP